MAIIYHLWGSGVRVTEYDIIRVRCLVNKSVFEFHELRRQKRFGVSGEHHTDTHKTYISVMNKYR